MTGLRKPPVVRDLRLADHLYFVQDTLDKSCLLDFLSDKAQRSLISHIARGLFEGYQEHDDYIISFRISTHMREHPLASLLGSGFIGRVHGQLQNAYIPLEEGRWPDGV